MNRLGEFLTKHRNMLLISLVAAAMLIGHFSPDDQPVTVDIPVIETAAAVTDPVESFRQRRNLAESADIAALEQLVGRDDLDEQTRRKAAERLQSIVDARQIQSAIEGALVTSSLYPCAVVLEGGILSIVTEKSAVTDRDTALVLSLAADLGGIKPEDVRIICGK